MQAVTVQNNLITQISALWAVFYCPHACNSHLLDAPAVLGAVIGERGKACDIEEGLQR